MGLSKLFNVMIESADSAGNLNATTLPLLSVSDAFFFEREGLTLSTDDFSCKIVPHHHINGHVHPAQQLSSGHVGWTTLGRNRRLVAGTA